MATKKPKRANGSKKPAKRNRLHAFFLITGKIALDLAKLSFASLVLGVIMRGEIPQEELLRAGIIWSGAGIVYGAICLIFLEEK